MVDADDITIHETADNYVKQFCSILIVKFSSKWAPRVDLPSVLLNALNKVATSISDITRTTQVTLKLLDYILFSSKVVAAFHTSWHVPQSSSWWIGYNSKSYTNFIIQVLVAIEQSLMIVDFWKVAMFEFSTTRTAIESIKCVGYCSSRNNESSPSHLRKWQLVSKTEHGMSNNSWYLTVKLIEMNVV